MSHELEITEITDRVIKSGGPALLFENVKGFDIPVIINMFGSTQRTAWALGVDDTVHGQGRVAHGGGDEPQRVRLHGLRWRADRGSFCPDRAPLRALRRAALCLLLEPIEQRQVQVAGRVRRLRHHHDFHRREVAQAGVELIGPESVSADAEIIALVVEHFEIAEQEALLKGGFKIDYTKFDWGVNQSLEEKELAPETGTR